jgi:hypothetical protein
MNKDNFVNNNNQMDRDTHIGLATAPNDNGRTGIIQSANGSSNHADKNNHNEDNDADIGSHDGSSKECNDEEQAEVIENPLALSVKLPTARAKHSVAKCLQKKKKKRKIPKINDTQTPHESSTNQGINFPTF